MSTGWNTFAFWYRQIWAESLGKQGNGTTPAVALGTVDQHSQLQLYLGGPTDKLFTFLIQDTAGQGAGRCSAGGDKALDYLAGPHDGRPAAGRGRCHRRDAVKAGRPTRIIRIADVDERVMGALMMHFMLETMFAAHLLGHRRLRPARRRGRQGADPPVSFRNGGGRKLAAP